MISAGEYADVLVKTIIVEYSPGDSAILRVDYITSGRLMLQGTLLGEFCGPITGLVESVLRTVQPVREQDSFEIFSSTPSSFSSSSICYSFVSKIFYNSFTMFTINSLKISFREER